jgi:hypothetical protein
MAARSTAGGGGVVGNGRMGLRRRAAQSTAAGGAEAGSGRLPGTKGWELTGQCNRVARMM